MTAPTCKDHGACYLVRGEAVYPGVPTVRDRFFWRCATCGAFVGCHPGTQMPLGSPAMTTTRQARKAAHEAFDRLWKNGLMTRGEAYAWASRRLEINPLHIGELDEAQCSKLVELAREKLTEDG